jgi:hypothetical protein
MDQKNKSIYLGRSAHLAVMSELAARGYKVTVPEIDVGLDVLAFLETEPGVTSLQVKSTDCEHLKTPGAFSGQIDVPLSQLMFGGDLYYVFAFGLDGEWVDYLIMSRQSLNALRVNEGIGTEYTKGKKTYVKLTFSFRRTGIQAGVRCGKVAFNEYRNAWINLPHPPGVGRQTPAQFGAGHPVHTAAQTAVMSRLLRMGCNVASVEIDKLLAFQDEEPGFTHIRVRGSSGTATDHPGAYTAEVALPLAELKFPGDLFYVFPFHLEGRCVDFVVISRERLNDLRLTKDLGSEYVDEATGIPYLKLAFSLSTETMKCGGEDFDDYRNAWTSLPPLAGREAVGEQAALAGAAQPVDPPGANNDEGPEDPAPEAGSAGTGP